MRFYRLRPTYHANSLSPMPCTHVYIIVYNTQVSIFLLLQLDLECLKAISKLIVVSKHQQIIIENLYPST